MQDSSQTSRQLNALATHLGQHRDAILSAWREAVDLDPALTTASTITRTQFVDHIPAVLDAFERRLLAHNLAQREAARADQSEEAAEHGLHRWQQGYNVSETMREWGHLHLCLLRELDAFETARPDLRLEAMPIARRALVRLCSDGVCMSAARYTQLQQAEAASRVRDLESALAQLKSVETLRAEAWREAAHDLRGSAHVIAAASAVLNVEGVGEHERTRSSEVLRLAVASLNSVLTDLMDHARLEAGDEQRRVTDFDAASMLKEFCESMRPLATDRKLFLLAEGPGSLPVQGDVAKVQRIAQNLVLNALKVTERGGVKVSWEEAGTAARPQWALCVQDTGPGFEPGFATPLERVLKHATIEAHEMDERALLEGDASAQPDPAPMLASQSRLAARLPSGEGIGLSIVKRLCELLDAGLELETAKDKGTTFRVVFPRRYAEVAENPAATGGAFPDGPEADDR